MSRTILGTLCAACAAALLSVPPCAIAQAPAGAASPVDALVSTTPELNRSDLETWLDGFLPNALQQADIAGAVVLVVKDGSVLLEKGYGNADLARKIQMDPKRTVLGVGSVSKLFTWTAVMQLHEEGKLDLDRDVNDYLDFKIPAAFGKPITMRQLMTHTAGFAERYKDFVSDNAPPHSLANYMRTINPPARIYAPGEFPAYSNYGAALAGYIVERVSGEPFGTYVAGHILKPLGMDRSAFCKPLPAAFKTDQAQYYHLASSGEVLPESANSRDPRCDPAGDLVSTADDMSRFMLAHLQRGRYGGFQLLRPETTEEMHAPTFVPIRGAPGTALGFFHMDYDDSKVIAHDGDLSGSHTDLELLPDASVGFFLNVNSDGTGAVLGGAYHVRASLFHHFMNRYFPPRAHPDEPTLSSAQAHSKVVAGEYEMTRRPSSTFVRAFSLALRVPITANEDGTIRTPGFLSLDTGQPQTWREVAPFTWQEVGGSSRLFVQVEDADRVTKWARDDVPSIAFLPVSPLWSGALNLPILGAAALLLLGASLAWPIGVLVRRHFGRAPLLTSGDGRHRLLTRLSTVTGAAFLLAWAALIAAISGGVASFDPTLDPWLRLIQLIGLVCVVAAAFAVWNAWWTCASKRTLWAKIWSVVLALALIDLVWFSLAFHLISSSLNY
jgi:CubicO group peptidase (beta-lactamase class C family)